MQKPQNDEGGTLGACVVGVLKLTACGAAVAVVIVLILRAIAESPSSSISQSQAVEFVSHWTIEIHTGTGVKQYTVEDLIHCYDPATKTIHMMRYAEGSLDWNSEFTQGKYVVSCRYNNRLYSFETDLTEVVPITSAAEELLQLQQSSFE